MQINEILKGIIWSFVILYIIILIISANPSVAETILPLKLISYALEPPIIPIILLIIGAAKFKEIL